MSNGIDKMIRDSGVSKAQEGELRQALEVVHQPACPPRDGFDCRTLEEYLEGWQKIAKISPQFGYKLLYQPRYGWPDFRHEVRGGARSLPGGFLEGDGNTVLNWERWEKEFGAEGYDRTAWKREIWNKALAYRWMLKHMPIERRAQFLRETISQVNPAERRIMLEIADHVIPKEECRITKFIPKDICSRPRPPILTVEEKNFLTAARASFETRDPDGFYDDLAFLIRSHLVSDMEYLEHMPTEDHGGLPPSGVWR